MCRRIDHGVPLWGKEIPKYRSTKNRSLQKASPAPERSSDIYHFFVGKIGSTRDGHRKTTASGDDTLRGRGAASFVFGFLKYKYNPLLLVCYRPAYLHVCIEISQYYYIRLQQSWQHAAGVRCAKRETWCALLPHCTPRALLIIFQGHAAGFVS